MGMPLTPAPLPGGERGYFLPGRGCAPSPILAGWAGTIPFHARTVSLTSPVLAG